MQVLVQCVVGRSGARSAWRLRQQLSIMNLPTKLPPKLQGNRSFIITHTIWTDGNALPLAFPKPASINGSHGIYI